MGASVFVGGFQSFFVSDFLFSVSDFDSLADEESPFSEVDFDLCDLDPEGERLSVA